MTSVEVHPLVCRLSLDADGSLDHQMYHALRTIYSLDDALDLAEISDVGRSWKDASAHNEQAIHLELSRRQRESLPSR